MRFGSEQYYMRAASATGALYPIELYLVTSNLPGLDAGVYHFNPLDFALVRLREGDYRADLANASDESCTRSPFTIVMTSLAWRNAWKYEARSYRHWFWDSGVIAANLLATCASEGLPIKLVLGFVDSKVDELLRLEALKEATVCLAVLGPDFGGSPGPKHREFPELRPNVEPLSREEVDYPIIWEANKASEFSGRGQVREWTAVGSFKPAEEDSRAADQIVKLRPLKSGASKALAEVILQRGSSRRFGQVPISFEALSTILQASKTPIPFEFLPDGESLINFYFIVNNVDGLPSGSYFYNQEDDSLEELKLGGFRSMFLGMMHFQDKYNQDEERLQRCDIHYLTPDLRVIPFCSFNVIPEWYRDRIQKKYGISVEEWEKKNGEKLEAKLYRGTLRRGKHADG